MFMGAKSKNPETDKFIHSIYVDMREKKYNEAEIKIQKLADITSENNPDVVMARMELKRSQYN